MKIEFEDKSFIELKKSEHSDNIVIIIIQAKDFSNPLKKITNAVEISVEQFNELIKEFK